MCTPVLLRPPTAVGPPVGGAQQLSALQRTWALLLRGVLCASCQALGWEFLLQRGQSALEPSGTRSPWKRTVNRCNEQSRNLLDGKEGVLS